MNPSVVALVLASMALVRGGDEFAGPLGVLRRQAYVGETFRYEYAVSGLASMPNSSLRLVVDLAFDGMPVLHVERVRFAHGDRWLAVADPYFVWVTSSPGRSDSEGRDTMRDDATTRVPDRVAWDRLEREDGAALRGLFSDFESDPNRSLAIFDRLPERERTPLTVELVSWKRTTDHLMLLGPTTRRAIGEWLSDAMVDTRVRAGCAFLDGVVARPFAPIASMIAGDHPPSAIESDRWPRGFAKCVNVRERFAGAFRGGRDRFEFRGRSHEFTSFLTTLVALPNTRVELVFEGEVLVDDREIGGRRHDDSFDWSLLAVRVPSRIDEAGVHHPARYLARVVVPDTRPIDFDDLELPDSVHRDGLSGTRDQGDRSQRRR